jgi:hypothetical protein
VDKVRSDQREKKRMAELMEGGREVIHGREYTWKDKFSKTRQEQVEGRLVGVARRGRQVGSVASQRIHRSSCHPSRAAQLSTHQAALDTTCTASR